MSKFEFEAPFKNLGQELKNIREKLCESVAEVSGAVEIEIKLLKQIESGFERPSEELLMLLVSHFGIKDDDAVGLWELAGYDQPTSSEQLVDDLKTRPILMMMALDTRILYSDNAHVSADQSGVVLNFMQNGGSGQKPTTVARIGMSYVQAKKVSQVLNHTLTQVEALRRPKGLPSSSQHKQPTDKKPKSN